MKLSDSNKPKTPMDEIIEVMDTAFQLLEDKAVDYDNYGEPSWSLMSVDDMIGGAKYKLERARVTRSKSLNKSIDDILDALNYCAFIVARLKRLEK